MRWNSQESWPLAGTTHADFSSHVVSVLDGDTIDVLHNGQAERVRPNGIDCPN
jgi:endonuclease YncB( thermonuclease family)